MPVKKRVQHEAERDTCDVFAYDLARVRRLRKRLHRMEELAEVFSALGDPTRVKIVYALSQEEMCVCDLAALVGLSLQAVSYHLRLLRALRLVKYRRQGRRVFYSLDDEHVTAIVSQGMAHVEHD